MRLLKRFSFIVAILVFGLLILFLNGRRSQQSLYGVLGIEASGILQQLIGTENLLVIQSGTLPKVLETYSLTALVVSENRVDDPDTIAARNAGVPIITVLRHIDIASITSNIALLGKLTNRQPEASRWIDAIQSEIAQIQQKVSDKPLVRVLVLSPEGYTQGTGALITDLLTQIKGVNVAAEADIPEARQISDEHIRSFKPDVVLLLNWSPELASSFIDNALYSGIPAFDEQRIYSIEAPGKDVTKLTAELLQLIYLIHVWEF